MADGRHNAFSTLAKWKDLYWLGSRKGGALKPYCVLPSGGDCSYPGAVEIGDEMRVSYYSSHEGSTNIYLGRVVLKK